MSTSRPHEGGGNSSTSAASDEDVTVAQGVLLQNDPLYLRRCDQALWLLNHLHVPLRLQDFDKTFEVLDIIPETSRAGSSSNGGGGLSANSNSSRHLHSLASSNSRGMGHRLDKQNSGLLSGPDTDINVFTETLDRKFKFTEDTTFWNIAPENNVVFVIDISQSMYSLDPNTNEAHIQTALETMEKCLVGIVQPIELPSSLGLPSRPFDTHICASVIAYCPRLPGSYPVERDRKKLPFCRTLAHARQVTMDDVPEFMKTIRNFLFNYESELQDSLGSFPPPPPPIPADEVGAHEQHVDEKTRKSDSRRSAKSSRHSSRHNYGPALFESIDAAIKSKKHPKPGDTYTFTYDPDAPLLHSLQIADYFLKLLPEVCASSFVFLTDGVMRSNFATSKAQSLTSSLCRRNTKCTFIQVGSCGGFTPETTLGFVGDNELLLFLAAALDGSFIYASDCPDAVLPNRLNYYHQIMLVHETRLARTLVRHRYDAVHQGARRMGDMPRERLNTKNTGSLQTTQGGDPGFPWCPDCKPPVVDTVTARYSDYNIPVSMGVLIDTRLNEGFVIRNIQVTKLDRDGMTERTKVKLELVWHANITIVYRIINTHYLGPADRRDEHGSREGSTKSGSEARSRSESVASDGSVPPVSDRGQRNPNMVDIVIRSYNMFTLAFLQSGSNDVHRSEVFAKADMLHQFLKSITEKDERLRQLYSAPSRSPIVRTNTQPRMYIPPVIETAYSPLRTAHSIMQLATRIQPGDVDLDDFMPYTDWTAQHWHLYEKLLQFSKSGDTLRTLASYRHTTSVFIDSELILSCVDGMNFAETAKHGNRILNEFRAFMSQIGTWALLKDENTSVVFLRDHMRLSQQIPVFVVTKWEMATNWIMRLTLVLYNGTREARSLISNCVLFICMIFRSSYCDTSREPVMRAARPLHLLPMDMDITYRMPPNLLTTRDMGDMHTYVVEWRWTYLAREGTREDLSGEGSDSEIVRQALHRLALTLSHQRLSQDFTLLNAKGPSTGLMAAPDASKYDSCLTFYQERDGYDGEELLLACQYQVIVDMKQSSVTARTWIEPWSSRLIRSLFEDDFRILAPLGTFQQILQPERCFQLKVPNIAEFHSKRMNMFSIMAVVHTSRIGLRVVQFPNVSPANAVWDQPDGAESIKLDDPTFQITPEPDEDEDLEIQILDESGGIVQRIKATEYYKTHGREETRLLAVDKKLRIKHLGTTHGERRAILLERFMLTLFDKSEEGKYDPYIEKYRLNEYNPFILALINPGHPRKLFFNKLAAKWMTTGEFTMVAYRCFLEFALFKRCDAISVNAERFNKLRFAGSIVSELMAHSPGLHQATGVPNALDDHLFMDKWFVIRLPNNSSFLMVILPNVPLSAPYRDWSGQYSFPETESRAESPQEAESGSSRTHWRTDSQPASPPVYTPALESSITGTPMPSAGGLVAINAYTLVMECSMDNGEMRRCTRPNDVHMAAAVATKTKLNLHTLDVGCTDTRVPGDTFQGFVGQKEIPIPFTEFAVAEIRQLERMYSEAHLQTMYLALLLKRQVSSADLVLSQQSSLWRRRSIDVDITAFLHSQDAACISREAAWQAQDRQSLQERFAGLLGESFTALPGDATQGRLYYCRPTPDRRSELELCLQLSQNPLFINLQCSVEVLDSTTGHNRRLNMPIDQLPLSLERLCEQAGLEWRPPTDHFETSMDVRVILHINCMYLPEESVSKNADDANVSETKTLEPKPDRYEIDSRATRVFQKTKSLSSLVRGGMSSLAKGEPTVTDTNGDANALPSAVIAKRHTNAQIATLEGLPYDQLQLVRHCHRKLVRFIAQETLYALRDTHPVDGALLRQVWHTIATTVDNEVASDRFEFAHNRIDLQFQITNPDQARRRHAMDLLMAELLKHEGMPEGFPLGKLQQLDGIVYMRDVRSRSDRIEARARIRARALSDTHGGASDAASDSLGPRAADLADAIPSWFLIKPTATLDGVRILTHNYSIITNEVADNVLAETRQLLMVALRAANTRLLLEEMAETHSFPDQLQLPEAAIGQNTGTSTSRLGQHSYPEMQSNLPHQIQQQSRDDVLAGISSSPSAVTVAGYDKLRKQGTPGQGHTSSVFPNASEADATDTGGNQFNIASILKPFISGSELYSCEEQFTSTFPLHPRISQKTAIQAVLVGGMVNSRLSNCRNMFFVRDGSSLFYAVLTTGRKPYANPFADTTSNAAPAATAATETAALTGTARSTGPWPSHRTQSAAPSPLYIPDQDVTGAHTVATTSPDPSRYIPHTDSVSLMHPSASTAMRRRSPLVPPVNTSSMFSLTALAGGEGLGPASLDLNQPASPRLTLARNEASFRSGNNGESRFVIGDALTRNTGMSTTPESPSTRYLVSSLTNIETQQQQQQQSQPPGNPIQSPRLHPSVAVTSGGGGRGDVMGSTSRLQLSNSAMLTSLPTFESQTPNDPGQIGQIEEKTVRCIVLRMYGVDKPSKELTRGLVQQIDECITVHVTMPEMSGTLFRQVQLNDHDMNFLFPMCNPEPTILYLPLPRFVHDLSCLMRHFKQTISDTIPQFPSSHLVAKSMRRSFAHLRKRSADHSGSEDDDSDDNLVSIGTRVPDALRKDYARVLEGWEYDRQTPRRLPVERLVFLYNFFVHSGGATMSADMADIGPGIAAISALPLSHERVLAKSIWAELPAGDPSNTVGSMSNLGAGTGYRFDAHGSSNDPDTLGISPGTMRRNSSNLPHHRRVASCVNPDGSSAGKSGDGTIAGVDALAEGGPSTTLDQRQSYLMQRRVSHTPSPNDHNAQPPPSPSPMVSTPSTGFSLPPDTHSGNAGELGSQARPLLVSEMASLFKEYLRQFQDARSRLRTNPSDFENLADIMERQVEEFAGQPVMSITLWSNTSVRVDRLAAFISRSYWNALGDYVSEQVLYPILSAGWGSGLNHKIRLPDPYADLELCSTFPGEPASCCSCPADVEIKLDTEWGSDPSTTQVHQALLRARDIHLPRAPSTFTEGTKRQVHAMEIARKMAQYWGNQETVKSLRHHRQRLPRVTGISHYFSEELRGVLETMCPAMKPTLFRLLENPLVLDGSSDTLGQESPTSLFPAHTLRKPTDRSQISVVYDVSALPKALKGTRQSFCIMCTLPLEGTSAAAATGTAHGVRSDRPSYQQQYGVAGSSHNGQTSSNAGLGGASTVHGRRLETLKKTMGSHDNSGGIHGNRHSTRSSGNSGLNHGVHGQVHGLGLQGWPQGDHMAQQRQQHFGPHAHRMSMYGSSSGSNGKVSGDIHHHTRRAHRLAAISERNVMSTAPKKKPPITDYKPIADPETPILNVEDITHYSSQTKGTSASTKAWLTVWLVGGELEMVGYNVSQRLWDCICDQIRQRLERESRRKQLLGMFASHMCGIFPGYDQQPRHAGISSTWLDRDVTRDLINKFALLKQLTYDDQIHYFNIERLLSSDYKRLLNLPQGAAELEHLAANPSVAGMTLNDTKTELVLRQLQPEHLRWARKLTFVDYTQPYVDTNHPDILFRIGTRFMRAYQSRIAQVLRYDELMKIAERWRQLIAVNGLHDSMNRSSRLVMLDLQTSDGNRSLTGEGQTPVRHTSFPIAGPRPDPAAQAPSRGDSQGGLTNGSPDILTKAAGKMPAKSAPSMLEGGKETSPTEKVEDTNEMSLEDIQMIMENARLLHFVCAPLPISTSIKPAGTDLRAFKRLFRVVSAMLQNLADSYIDYLCSTGYIVARRFEKMRSWKDSLVSLGYTADKVTEFTNTILGQPRQFFTTVQGSTAEAALPGIQIPSAYLFGSTERTNLVTDIEVSPEMLSIRMHALSRFTPEWRSAVPGYLRSSVNPQSIKKFTFDISRYKKLLHAKSFVYDFQLRYVALMLKPLASSEPHSDEQHVLNLPETRPHDCRDHAIYSSDSDDTDSRGGVSSNEDDSTDSADEDDCQILVAGDSFVHPTDTFGSRSQRHYQPPLRRRCSQRTVAQGLHVHIDLTVFLGELSEQRYFSTRFSSRRLVRARFPMMYREMYEYFLTHSSRYQFYTDGCRPPLGENPLQGGVSPSSRSVPVDDLCLKKASHSGCYRLYEGVLPDAMQTQYASVFSGSEPHSGAGSYHWPSGNLGTSPMHKNGIPSSGRGHKSGLQKYNIASSAPETLHKSPQIKDGSLDSIHHLRVNPMAFNSQGRGGQVYSGVDHASPQHMPPNSDNIARRGRGIDSRPIAMSYAPGTHWTDGYKSTVDVDSSLSSRRLYAGGMQSSERQAVPQAPKVTTSDQYINSSTHHVPLSSSPRVTSSLGSHTSRAAVYEQHQPPTSALTEPMSTVSRSLDFAVNEYSASRIHLSSNDTFVRVSLMALTPDCDTCRSQHIQDERRSRERQRSLAQQQHSQQHRHINSSETAPEDGVEYPMDTNKKRKHKHHKRHARRRNGGGPSRIIDDIGQLFGPLKGRPMTSSNNAFDYDTGRPYRSSAVSKKGSISMSGTSGLQYRYIQQSQQRYPSSSPFRTANDHGAGYDSRNTSRLQQWMASLASDIITDPHADGLSGCGGLAGIGSTESSTPFANDTSHCETAQLSYYLVIDMDPQTTQALNNLKSDDVRSRNGSLVPLGDRTSSYPDEAGVENLSHLGIRPCKSCQSLSRCAGRLKVCGMHKVLNAIQVDMRDWENKGDVWANEPTMVMEVSSIDPDEYDKEDPDVLAWIRKTARRMIRHTVVDYHRDFNWYRIYQHMRMADLPNGLAPAEISDLVNFIERQGWVDVGTTDDAAQKLIGLGISAQRAIETIQLRLRKLYLEPALLIPSLLTDHANTCTKSDGGGTVPPSALDEGERLPDVSHRRQTTAGPVPSTGATTHSATVIRRNAVSSSSLNTSAADIPQTSEIHMPRGFGTNQPAISGDADPAHVDPDNIRNSTLSLSGGPVAVIDVHGRVLPDRSSTNIGDLLRLLSPLNTHPTRKILLDPTFQKMLSRYIRLDITDSPWLCGKHRQTYSLSGFDWDLDDDVDQEAMESGMFGGDPGPCAAIPRGFTTPQRFAPDDGVARSTNRRVQQVQEIDIGPSAPNSIRNRAQRRRTGASATSLGTMEPVANSAQLAHGLSAATAAVDSASSVQSAGGHGRIESYSGSTSAAIGQQGGNSLANPLGPNVSDTKNGPEPAATADRFTRPYVESLPGSLLVIDPDDTQYAARLFVLNPFAYHSVLELMFTRAVESGEVQLCQVRAIARDRQRSGLYEYERKHINMLLSTLSAVIWDVMTE